MNVSLMRKRGITAVSKPVALIALLLMVFLLVACGGGGGAEPKVSFQSPTDGQTVNGTVRVVMQAENFTVEESGDVNEGAGHMHIMVDTPCVAVGEVIPNDENHLHFGDGSTEAELQLSSGTHTLCLQAADGAHVALEGDGMTDEISITVE